MATVFENLSLNNIRRADLQQLLGYINHIEQEGIYWGNKEQFNERHERIKTLIEDAVDYAYKDGVKTPKNK